MTSRAFSPMRAVIREDRIRAKARSPDACLPRVPVESEVDDPGIGVRRERVKASNGFQGQPHSRSNSTHPQSVARTGRGDPSRPTNDLVDPLDDAAVRRCVTAR